MGQDLLCTPQTPSCWEGAGSSGSKAPRWGRYVNERFRKECGSGPSGPTRLATAQVQRRRQPYLPGLWKAPPENGASEAASLLSRRPAPLSSNEYSCPVCYTFGGFPIIKVFYATYRHHNCHRSEPREKCQPLGAHPRPGVDCTKLTRFSPFLSLFPQQFPKSIHII